MNVKRVAITGLAVAGLALSGAAVAAPASADTQTHSQAYGYWPVLKQGQTSENVRALQWFLNCQGYRLDTPSRFGPKTYGTVKAYQDRHMKDGRDGNVGAETWEVLLQRAKPAGYGQRNDCVKALQVLLNKWRYNDDLPITGYHGDRTKAKVLRFQDAHGLPATGQVGIRTYHKLISTPAGK